MYGAFYDNQTKKNPEAIGEIPKSPENGELTPEQQKAAEAWGKMANEVLEGNTPQSTETEPTIPETEPVLQKNLEEGMTQEQIDMANAEAALSDAQIKADQAVMNGENPDDFEEVEEEYTTPDGATAIRKVRRYKAGNGNLLKPGTPVQGMDAEATMQAMAAMTPAGAVVTEAVDHALEYAKQGINDIDGPKGSGIPGGGGEDGAPEDTPEDETPETPEEPENPGNTETPAGIQHFPQGASESSFNPLPPEEQLAQLKARETAQPSRYDGDNLVAEAVSDGSGKGTIDLDSTGGKLEGEGVGIQDEVEKMDADIANDVAMAGGDKAESNIKPEQTADNLSVDAGAKALAVKEKAADVVTAIERDDKDVDAKITEFNQAASETEQLTGTAESASIEAGKEISETVGEARKMTEEAKNAVNEAKAEADANKEEEEKKDEDGGENEGDDNDSQFNSDKYPELKDLEKGDRQSIFM